MVKTYILAPNWTTAPPPDGPIQLGHLIDDLTELVPINRKGIIEIPPSHHNKVDTKAGFTASRSSLVAGDLGFTAKLLGLFGIGIDASIFYNKDKNDVLSCKALDTLTFDPTVEYINDSMNVPEVQRFMQGARFKSPLYMVTGFKVARGASLNASSAQGRGLQIRGGLQVPGAPVEVGFHGGHTRQQQEAESWDESTDFIVAFRVRKIWYQSQEMRSKAYNKNAVMQDGSSAQNKTDHVMQIDAPVSVMDVSSDIPLALETQIEDGEVVNWILKSPK